MKIIYFIGLILTMIFIGLRIFMLREWLTIGLIVREVLIGLLSAHLLLAISYAGMSLIRIIFQSWFSELRMIGFWISNMTATLALVYFYVKTIHIDFWFFSAYSGFAMLIIGLLLESYPHIVSDFDVDKDAKEIKDEDFKIQFK